MQENRNIIIDIDSILDIRLVILYVLYPNGIEEITKNYQRRKSDKFGNIPYNLFKVFYEKRSKSILNYALFTNIFKVIEEVILEDRSHITRALDKETIYINTYPYSFTDNERELWSKKIKSYLSVIDIEFVFLSKEKLTPSFIIEKDIYTIIMYDGLEWLEKQISLLNIVTNPLLNRSLIVPALVNTNNVLDMKIDKDLFVNASKMYDVFMDVVFIDAKMFSPNIIKK